MLTNNIKIDSFVNEFFCYLDKAFLFLNEDVLIVQEMKFACKIKIDFGTQLTYYFENNFILVNSEFSKYKCYQNENLIFENEDVVFNFFDNDYLFYYDRFIKRTIIKNIKHQSEITFNDRLKKVFRFNNNYYFNKYNDELNKFFYLLNKNTGLPFWQYVIPDNYGYKDSNGKMQDSEINRIIGEHKNILYISSSTGWLISLDVETGKEKFSLGKPHKYFEGFDYNYDTNEVFIGNYVMLNAKKGKMYSIIGTWYAEIDLTGTIPFYEIFDIKEDLENCGFKSIAPNFENKFDGKYYIFDEHRLKEFEGAIGIFDMEKRKIVWTSMANLPERPYFKDIKKMELKGNKLYVLEKQGDFYIFEIYLP